MSLMSKRPPCSSDKYCLRSLCAIQRHLVTQSCMCEVNRKQRLFQILTEISTVRVVARVLDQGFSAHSYHTTSAHGLLFSGEPIVNTLPSIFPHVLRLASRNCSRHKGQITAGILASGPKHPDLSRDDVRSVRLAGRLAGWRHLNESCSSRRSTKRGPAGPVVARAVGGTSLQDPSPNVAGGVFFPGETS